MRRWWLVFVMLLVGFSAQAGTTTFSVDQDVVEPDGDVTIRFDHEGSTPSLHFEVYIEKKGEDGKTLVGQALIKNTGVITFHCKAPTEPGRYFAVAVEEDAEIRVLDTFLVR